MTFIRNTKWTEYSLSKAFIQTQGRFHFTNQESTLIRINHFLPWEADILQVSKSGKLTEFEVKINLQDWRNDFKKEKWKEKWKKTWRFYYLIPDNLSKYSNEIIMPSWAGILSFNTHIEEIKSPGLNNIKLSVKDRLKLLRLAGLRSWYSK
jgi:hypothetical protein